VYKIIPAGLTAAYIAGQSYLGVPQKPEDNIIVLVGRGVFLTALVPFYLMRFQKVFNWSQIENDCSSSWNFFVIVNTTTVLPASCKFSRDDLKSSVAKSASDFFSLPAGAVAIGEQCDASTNICKKISLLQIA